MIQLFEMLVTAFIFPFVLHGWGTLLGESVLPAESRKNLTFWQGVMLGFPTLAFLSYLLNFVLPISNNISDVVWALGLLFSYFLGLESHKTFFKSRLLFRSALFVTFVLLVLTRVESHLYDTGYYMYHFRWMKEARMLVGMANMNIGFGVNSMWLGLGALAWGSLSSITGAFVMNTVLVTTFLMVLLEQVPFKKLISNSGLSSHEIFLCLVFIYFLLPTELWFGRQLIMDTLGSPDTTEPATLYTVLASIWFLNSFWSKDSKVKMGLFVSVCSAFAVATKLTTGVFIVLPFLWLFFERKNMTLRKIGPTILFVVLFMIVYEVRSFALSGCIAFPAMCTPWAPWSVEAAKAAYYALEGHAYVIDFGETAPAKLLASWGWVDQWAVRLLRLTVTKTYLYFFILGALFYQFRAWFAAKGTQALRIANLLPDDFEISPLRGNLKAPERALIILCLLGLVVWFRFCPDLRYGYSYFVNGSIMMLTAGLMASGLHKAASRYFLLLMVIGAVTFALNPRMEKTLRSWVQNPGQAFPLFPQVEIVEAKTKAGDTYYYPKKSDRCWMSPLTCVSLPNDDFHLDMSGFYPMATRVSGKNN